MFELIPPAIYMILAAALIGPARGHVRNAIVLGAPLLTLWFIWQVPDGVVYDVAFLDYRIEPLEGSSVRRLFATIFALMAFVGGLFAFRQAKWYELAAAYAYGAAASSYHLACRNANSPPTKAMSAKIVANSRRTELPSSGSMR